MMPVVRAARRPRPAVSPVGLQWVAYAGLLVLLAAYYAALSHVPGSGVDFACFRAAATLYQHGGNPFDFGQLWRVENALYNVPQHLHPGSPGYYYLDRYYNPPLFATILRPLALLPFAQGYAIYTAMVIVLAVAGTWLTLCAVGWTRYRIPAIAIALLSPSLFIAVRNGQQSTLILCALGGALYALRRGRPGLGGAILALSLVKPHLLGPFVLAAPLLFPVPRQAVRWYIGFFSVVAAMVALTIATTGAGSIVAWLHTLVGYSGNLRTLNSSLPSLSGISMDILPPPWGQAGAAACTALGVAMMAAIVLRTRRTGAMPWAWLGALIAVWLLFTPYAHANDDVLLLAPLAVAWKEYAAARTRMLPILALWACSALPLAFLLPPPFNALTAAPPALVLAATLVTRDAATESTRLEQG